MARKKSREQRKCEERRRKLGAPVARVEEHDVPAPVEADDAEGLPWPELPSRFITERAMRGMFEAPRGRNDKRAQAQDLAYEAMESRDPEKAAALAVKAVALDPHCVDALTILAQVASADRNELIENIRVTVQAGERDLGREFFQENRGHFWGLLETRPYMRARAYLAELLLAEGRSGDATREYEELLGLNPNDNQGLRYPLLGCYLAAGNLAGVRRLFQEYEDEGSAMFTWARVLERYLAHDATGAAAALKDAREANAHVEKYLTGRKPMPAKLPGYYGMGDESEAVICADAIGVAWRQNPQAVDWLNRAG